MGREEEMEVRREVRRMVRVGEREERRGGFGRVFRGPRLFEDMVKCILLCNCQWSRTLSMARALCELQLKLQGLSMSASVHDSHQTNLKSSAVRTEHFTPRTPAVKEPSRKHRRSRVSKRLWREDEGNDTLIPDEISRTIHIQASKCAQMLENALPASTSTEQDDSHGESITCTASVAERNEAVLGEIEPFFDPTMGNFPSPEEIATLDENFLAKRCNLGYRAGRILKLAQGIVEGRINLEELEQLSADPSLSNYEKVDEKLKEIHGFGPFTRANVLMCLGFYNVIPVDSETIRHLKQVHGISTTSKTVHEVVDKIYGKFAPFQFLAYWSEIWKFYEERFGKLSEMNPSDYKLITASNMRIKQKRKN